MLGKSCERGSFDDMLTEFVACAGLLIAGSHPHCSVVSSQWSY